MELLIVMHVELGSKSIAIVVLLVPTSLERMKEKLARPVVSVDLALFIAKSVDVIECFFLSKLLGRPPFKT